MMEEKEAFLTLQYQLPQYQNQQILYIGYQGFCYFLEIELYQVLHF